MENYSYSSYPDSHDSTPRSRDNDSSWDDQQPPPPSSNYKVKFMCSYGGKIQPRPHDNQLTYVGGDTKILAVDRNIRFSTIISKLSSFIYDVHNNDICFKYQLPGEDLDALISVTNDEDLDHMMLEYDRLCGSAGSRPARLRIFLFPISSSNSNSNQSSLSFCGEVDSAKPTQQWFVDALNSVPIQSLDTSSPAANASNADFLFGFEQQHHLHQSTPKKSTDPKPEFEMKTAIGSDTGGDSMYEMQKQIQELQRLQISNQEYQQQQQNQQAQAAMLQRKPYQAEYYMTEKPAPLPTAPYWQPAVAGAYSDHIAGTERQVYMIPSQPPASGVRQVTGQVSQGYGMQRVAVPEMYREQPVYTMGPPQIQLQPQPQPQPQMVAKMVTAEATGGYTGEVSYDSYGRKYYHTTAPSSYPTAVSVGPRQSGPLIQDGKVVNPP